MFEVLPALTVGAATVMVSMNAFGTPTTSTDAFSNHFSSKDCRDGDEALFVEVFQDFLRRFVFGMKFEICFSVSP